MKKALILFTLLLFITGCNTTETVVTPLTPATQLSLDTSQELIKAKDEKITLQGSLLSKTLSNLNVIGEANKSNVDSNAKEAVKEESTLSADRLTSAGVVEDPQEKIRGLERTNLILQGQFQEAQLLYNKERAENMALKQQVATLNTNIATLEQRLLKATETAKIEIAKATADLTAWKDRKEAELQEALQKAKKSLDKVIIITLSGLGGVCIVIAIGWLILSNGQSLKLSIGLIMSGVSLIGISQLIAQPWFKLVFIGLLTVIGISAAIAVYFNYRDRKSKEKLERAKELVFRGIQDLKDDQIPEAKEAWKITKDYLSDRVAPESEEHKLVEKYLEQIGETSKAKKS